MKIRLLSVILGAVVGAVTAAGVSPVMATMGGEEAVHACATGEVSVRLVDDPNSDCLTTERAVTWNRQGPPGLMSTYVNEATGEGRVVARCDDSDDLLLGGGYDGQLFIEYTVWNGRLVSKPRTDISPVGWEVFMGGYDLDAKAYVVCGVRS